MFECLGDIIYFSFHIAEIKSGYLVSNLDKLNETDRDVNLGFQKLYYYGVSKENELLQAFCLLNNIDPKYHDYSMQTHVSELMAKYILFIDASFKATSPSIDKNKLKEYEKLFYRANEIIFDSIETLYNNDKDIRTIHLKSKIFEFGKDVENL